jgi:hypothetical protein
VKNRFLRFQKKLAKRKQNGGSLIVLKLLPDHISCFGIIFLNPLFIIPAGDIAHPFLVVEIPLDGFADACLKGFLRFPA